MSGFCYVLYLPDGEPADPILEIEPNLDEANPLGHHAVWTVEALRD